MQNTILTVGSMAFDSVETPAGKAQEVLGGSVNYFSVAASFYSPIQVVTVVGNDFPEAHLKWMNSKNIDTAGVEVMDGKTFHWVGKYDQNLNEAQTLSTFLNVLEKFDPKLNSKHKTAPFVFLGNMDPEMQLNVLNQTNGPQLVACDTMNFWITGKKDALLKTLQHIDILSINDGEAYLLSDEKNLGRAAKKILTMGPKALVIKRGEFGATLFTGDHVFLSPAYPTENVKDPTGAGDSFAGGFMGYLAKEGATREWMDSKPEKWIQTLKNAVVSGSIMASFTVEDFSLNRLKDLTHDELEARKNRFLEMTTI